MSVGLLLWPFKQASMDAKVGIFLGPWKQIKTMGAKVGICFSEVWWMQAKCHHGTCGGEIGTNIFEDTGCSLESESRCI